MTALTKLFRTTTFRLSLTYLALFSAAAIVAIAYIYWNTTVLLSRQLNQTIDAELKGLAEQYRAGGLEQLVRTVAERSGTPGNSLYLVADSEGRRLAGNLGVYLSAQQLLSQADGAADPFGPPAVAREIEEVTAASLGQSLLEVDARRIEDTIRALPSVDGASVDRAFPNTLVIKVSPERPVAVAHRRTSSWLVTGGGKVIREIDAGSHRGFPRLWIPKGVGLRAGGSLPTSFLPATRALAAVREARIPRRVKAVRSTAGELTLVLRHGPEIRLGASRDLRLKLAVAARVFPLLPDGALYLDVSVPERPVTSRYYLNP